MNWLKRLWLRLCWAWLRRRVGAGEYVEAMEKDSNDERGYVGQDDTYSQ